MRISGGKKKGMDEETNEKTTNVIKIRAAFLPSGNRGVSRSQMCIWCVSEASCATYLMS